MRSVSKQSHPQPHVHSNARTPSPETVKWPIQTPQEETRHYC